MKQTVRKPCREVDLNPPPLTTLSRFLFPVNMLLSPVAPVLPRKTRQEIDSVIGNAENTHFLSTICLTNRSSNEYFIRTTIMTAAITPETNQGGSESEQDKENLAKKQHGWGLESHKPTRSNLRSGSSFLLAMCLDWTGMLCVPSFLPLWPLVGTTPQPLYLPRIPSGCLLMKEP